MAENFGSGIRHLKLCPEINDFKDYNCQFLSIFAGNMEEWYMMDIAAMLFGLTLSPLYDTLGPKIAKYILNQTRTNTLALTGKHIEKIVTLKKSGDLNDLSNLILMESFNISQELIASAKEAGFNVYTVKQIVDEGKAHPTLVKDVEVSPDSVWTLCYTSGTTGDPKGAMINQGNFCSELALFNFMDKYKFESTDQILSYLPLAHIAARLMYTITFTNGGKVACFNDDKKKLTQYLAIVKPTLFLSVPRLYNRFFAVMKGKLDQKTGCVACLVRNGIKTKLANLHNKGVYTHGFYDAIVFKKLRLALGGRVRLMITGAAPLDDEVKDFFKVAMGCPMLEAYG